MQSAMAKSSAQAHREEPCFAEGNKVFTFIWSSHAHSQPGPHDPIDDVAIDDVERALSIPAGIPFHELIMRVIPPMCPQTQAVVSVVSGLEASDVICTPDLS